MQEHDAAIGTPAWTEVEALLDLALDLPDADRDAFVVGQCPDQAAHPLRDRVLELLGAERAADQFLRSGASLEPEPVEAARGLPAGTRIGVWRLKRLIGSGGMGEVYRAERADGQYLQVAALKLIAPGAAAQTERFLRERQILAELDHPGIARLLDGGLGQDGRPFMVMEHVRGEPILRYCHAHDLGLAERIGLMIELCEAVAYAHARLIVHRDIKPDNVMVDDEGRPRLLDFGIALLLSDATAEMTQALATPSYAAPEQLSRKPITTATDVYALGGLLYALLTSRPPLDFSGQSLPRVIDRVLHESPPRPSTVLEEQAGARYGAHALRGDLDAICRRALRKNPARRYPSVEALASDLRRYLTGEPVAAREGGKSYRTWRFLLRHRLAVTLLGLVFLSLAGGLAGTLWQARQAAAERDLARHEADRLAGLRSAILQLLRTAAREPEGSEVSAQGLFRRSADRIDLDFGHDPDTAANLMQMLGRLQLHTENYTGAKTLLERALAHPGLSAAVTADARHDLAQIAFRDGHLDRATRLAGQARSYWGTQPDRYRAERIWGTTMASQLSRAAGDARTALELMQQAAEEASNYWGEPHSETGIVLINLAVAYYYANRLEEALDTCARAWAVWVQLDRREAPDALNLLANWGLFALRHGDLEQAERRLTQALTLRRGRYPPSAADASLMKNLGTVRALNGDQAALTMLAQARDLAARYAGAGGALHGSTGHAQARALDQFGHHMQAQNVIEETLKAIGKREHLWGRICLALRAEFVVKQGRTGVGLAMLEEGIEGLRLAGPAGASWLADALATQSRALLQLERRSEARAALTSAWDLKRSVRSDDHHEALLLQARLGRLIEEDGETARGKQLTRQAIDRMSARLGREHPLTRHMENF